MTESKAVDYAIPKDLVHDLMGLIQFRHEARIEVLSAIQQRIGTDALLDLFSQFVGLANSVVANNREMAEMLLITEGNLYPHQAEKANLPTLFGALNGLFLASGIDQSNTCGGCAFRVGTCANQSAPTTCDASWCRDSDEQFMCHEDLDALGYPIRKCTGYTQARRIRAKSEAA